MPSEPLPNCPCCGEPGTHTGVPGYVECTVCDCNLPTVDWRRLAAAVALLGAVERLEVWLRTNDATHGYAAIGAHIDLAGIGMVASAHRGTNNPERVEEPRDTLAAALVALAQGDNHE